MFKSKASTLAYLQKFEDLNIPQPIFFSFSEWNNNSKNLLDNIITLFANQKLAIRSSCSKEDSCSASGAGAFLSLLNIDSQDINQIREAIDKVFASYGHILPDDQILIQPMVPNPVLTGVIMTRSLSDGAHYYVVNYDDESGRTDTITGGAQASKTVFVYRNVREGDFDSPRLKRIVSLAKRLEEICLTDSLDIEFSISANGALYLLQVRPICSSRHWGEAAVSVNDYIGQVAKFVETRTAREAKLYGSRSILGIMPDWNPAEMIGILPHHLDTSLYREIITSHVWASARRRMGYHPVPTPELMVVLAGRPYIDVRLSFNSFLPKNLDPVTSEALVSAWLEYLAANPQYHDKVEFEVAQTCLDFCFDENLNRRYGQLLTKERREAFRSALCYLTSMAMSDEPGSTLNAALDRITELRVRNEGRSGLSNRFSILRIGELLSECRKYGTLPFAIIARHAFIAESLLKTAVIRGAIQPERVGWFKRTIRTISGSLSEDFFQVCQGNRTSVSFLDKYGHLRPGSYNILSPRYADRPNLFHSAGVLTLKSEEAPPFELTKAEKAALEKLLTEAGLSRSAEGLLAYAEKAIAGRELGKFVFSRNLSDVLEAIAFWAEDMNLSREDASYLPVQALLNLNFQIGVEDTRSMITDLVAKNRDEYDKWHALKLGYLIRSERDIFIVPQHRAAPNFIGRAVAVAPPVFLKADSSCDSNLTGKIILIENADPGFDWIFTRGIAGLVTKFGGANSHMAIRCAEYGLPAAIGIGEHLFAQLPEAEQIVLDPANSVLKKAHEL